MDVGLGAEVDVEGEGFVGRGTYLVIEVVSRSGLLHLRFFL